MPGIINRYVHWLHTQWPAGVVEKLPYVREDSTTNVPGFYITGDLTGIPLLKFASDKGARAVRHIVADSAFQKSSEETKRKGEEIYDVAIIGGGVSGMAAALEAETSGLRYILFEAAEPFATIANFPKAKPIFTYPTDMTPAGGLQFKATVKEPLLEDLRQATAAIEPRKAKVEKVVRRGKVFEVVIPNEESVLAHRTIVAIGRSGNFRKLGVPGEDLGKVFNRLHDPKDYCAKSVLIVGGGDSAMETAIALASCGANVTLSYRKKDFSRPKPENVERLNALAADPMADVAVEEPISERVTTSTGGFLKEFKKAGSIRLMMASKVKEIREEEAVVVDSDGQEQTMANDAVFAMIGREAPLDFFRRSGIKIRGETYGAEWVAIAAFFLFIFAVYDWKNDGFISHQLQFLSEAQVFPNNAPSLIASFGDAWAEKVADRSTLLGTLAVSMKSRSFYYTLAYTTCIGLFGIARVRRRKTPYVKLQTATLFSIQLFPLFLLPELLLPWLGYNGVFDSGVGRTITDNLFERYISEGQYLAHDWPEWGHPRAYWRAYGLVLAWPLMVYNVFTPAPIVGWLVISVIQTFVLIPTLIYFWGKGAYCGWICSCGGLAETMGDNQRHKMPHGPFWNRLNMAGQVLLFTAFILLAVRIAGWIWPESWMNRSFALLLDGKTASGTLANPVSWKWMVDVLLGGILGVGLYFKYSGRVWCRFFCPLAALMHIFARFSRFRILSEKKKCISCNVCTSVCHQGIDIMNFANKGLPMNDPECVRCSACVQSCPTGVLQFGQVDPATGKVRKYDRLIASTVVASEQSRA